MNKIGGDAFALQGIIFQNLLGYKLTTGEIDWTLLGKLFSDWTGEWLHWMSGTPSGNNLRSRLPGMLVRNVCIPLGNVEIFGGYPLP